MITRRLPLSMFGPGAAEAVRACAISISGAFATFDRDSECYRRLVSASDLPRSRGLGDSIAKVTSALGIEPCEKCEDRRRTLNRRFPYR